MRLLIHGGAGAIHAGNANESVTREALKEALASGWAVLCQGGAALDAVQAAVVALENSGAFSAGKGASMDNQSQVTLDAAIMAGDSKRAGAVAAVALVKNPIEAARLVMDRTHHVLMVGEGALSFLKSQGVAMVQPAYFSPAYNDAASAKQGTVGAVALDAKGCLAAATSTGGTPAKLPGRVGDSPLIGAGTYADDACAVSATGQGEFFIRTVFAHRVAMNIRYGSSVDDAARTALQEVTKLGGEGGAIALGRDGRWSMPFVTQGMFRGVIDAGGAGVAIFPNDVLA